MPIRPENRRRQAELLILGALAKIRPGSLSGYPLAKTTGLSPGRLYRALAVLERDGWIESQWAAEPMPRRRLDRLASTDSRRTA